MDEHVSATEFIGGVVEGFYGRPWTMSQRLALIQSMPQWGLNTYFYAPKDDLNHRAIWRELYDAARLADLRRLIDASRQYGVRFIYGLSPGLDMRFSEPDERQRIEQRFTQLADEGCRDFALLFDDLPGNLSDQDRERFASVAEAQAFVANQTLQAMRSRNVHGRFLFCPTPYCDRMDRWALGGENYLERLGDALSAEIDVLWTGPEIISRDIPVDSVVRLRKRIGRVPLIWDNLHANDYDGRRLFTGPYSGRSPELKRHVAGILANPNNEFPINEVPLRTLGMYLRCDDHWAPREAYLRAIEQWHVKYEVVGKKILREDLELLSDCFYLPFEDGESANQLAEIVQWMLSRPVEEWGDRENQFERMNRRVQTLFEQLTELRDRELFYAWSRRAWDLKEELQLLQAFLAHKKQGEQHGSIETHLPQTYRGGFIARLQRLLTMDAQGRFHAAKGDDR